MNVAGGSGVPVGSNGGKVGEKGGSSDGGGHGLLRTDLVIPACVKRIKQIIDASKDSGKFGVFGVPSAQEQILPQMVSFIDVLVFLTFSGELLGSITSSVSELFAGNRRIGAGSG